MELGPLLDGDIPDVVDLINRSNLHDGVPYVRSPDELAEQFAADDVSAADDVRVVRASGRIVGWTHTVLLPAAAGQRRCFIFGEVDPQHRSTGIGTALLAWAVRRGTAQLHAADPGLRCLLRAEAADGQPDRDLLLRAAGLLPVRWFEELLRPVADPPTAGAIPGVRIVDWPAPERDDEVRTVRNTAFADHWGSSPQPQRAWQAHVRGFAGRPDLSAVAVDEATGRIIGFSLAHRYEADDAVSGRRDGWIETLGTLREHRRRGIASALICDALRRFEASGLTHALIGVDGDSPTGAARLYRSLGFQRTHGAVVYQLEV